MTYNADSNPFVGLRPFESHESLLFFGRQEQTMELLQRLHQHHFVAVVGSSGSGKSSLVRAGLLPRLKAGYLLNDSDQWEISIMKPGQTSLCNLAEALLAGVSSTSPDLSATALEEKIKADGVDAILEILTPLWSANINFFLLVDQFEELFRFSFHQNSNEKKDEAKDFVNILLALSAQKHLPIYITLTMRSDFIGDCSQIHGLPEALNQSQYIVPRLNRVQLRTTIEGPVRLYNGRVNATLTARLLNDVQLVSDELPLLQHVLMRMWDYEEKKDRNGELDLEDYKEVGGLEKALSNHADEAMLGMTVAEVNITKKIFQALTTVDEHGRKIRRPVRLSELEALTGAPSSQLLSLIQRFVEGNKSFLVVSRIPNADDRLIDISHESLIRQWNTLNEWVDEEAEAGKLFLRLTDTARLYEKGQGDLITGIELQRVSEWFAAFNPGNVWAQRYSTDAEKSFRFLKESEKQRRALQKEQERQRLQKRRNRRLLFAGLVGVILLISAFAYSVYRNNVQNKKQLALNYWSTSQAAREKKDLLSSLHFTAEAAELSTNEDVLKNLLIDIEPFLPQTTLQNIFSFPDFITSAVFHPDNKRIAVASNDGSVRIIEKATGATIGSALMHEAPVTSASFSADGRWLLTGSNDATARIWDLASGKAIVILTHPGNVLHAALSPDAKEIVTACEDGYARLWDATTGKLLALLEHKAAVTDAVFSPSGKQILTVSHDASVWLWELGTKKQTVFSTDNTWLITTASFNWDGTRIVTAGADSTVRVWNTTTKEIISSWKNTSVVKAVAYGPNDRWLATAGADGYARLWDATTGKQLGAAMKHEGMILNMSFNAGGTEILTTGWDKVVRLWTVLPGTSEDKSFFAKQGNIVNAASFSLDGKMIVTASFDSTARLWDVATKKQVMTLPHKDGVTKAAFSANGQQVLTTCDDGLVRLWQVGSGQLRNSFVTGGVLTAAGFDPENKNVLVAGEGGKVIFLNAADLTPSDSFNYHTYINSITLSRDGNRLLIAGHDSSARLLHARSRKQIAVFRHQDEVKTAVFSPDETKVVTASNDFSVRLWNTASQQQIGSAMKHSEALQSAVFSPNGKWILTTGWDKTTRLWDVATQKEIGTSKYQDDVFTTAVFSPDGKQILTAGRDGSVRLWTIAGDLDIPTDLFKLQAKALTGVELNLGTGETQCLSLEQWTRINESYYEKGREHYKTCKFPDHNIWRRFHAGAAEAIHPK